MAESKLDKVDVTNLSLENLDSLDHDALKEALASVLRNPTASMQHQDHRSHSSSSGGTVEREQMVSPTVAHGGQALIRTRVSPIKPTAPPVNKTSPPVNKTATPVEK